MLSTVWNTQRGSQSSIEKRGGRKEIEVTRRRRVGIKRGENNRDSNQFPICSPQSGTLREVHRVTQRREKGRKEIEVTRRRGGGVKRRETSLACDQCTKCYPQPGTPKEINRVK